MKNQKTTSNLITEIINLSEQNTHKKIIKMQPEEFEVPNGKVKVKLVKSTNTDSMDPFESLIKYAEKDSAFLVAVFDDDNEIVDRMWCANLEEIGTCFGIMFTLHGVNRVHAFRVPKEDYNRINDDDWYDENGKPLPGNPSYDINAYIQNLLTEEVR
jgi:hypothetical protein